MKNIFYFILIMTFLGCEKDVPPTYLESVGSWENEIVPYKGVYASYVNSGIVEDVLIFRGVSLMFFFESDGTKKALTTSHQQSGYHRNFFSRDFFFMKDYTRNEIRISNEQLYYQYSDYLRPQNIDSSFTDYNFEYELGAGSDDNVAIVSLAKESAQSNIHLALFKVYNAEYNYARIDTVFGYIQVDLPAENDIAVHRMESDGTNFYITTTENSYRVEPNGDFQRIFDFPVREYFKYQNDWYADIENAIYKSSDDGMNWQIVADNLDYEGFRQFFTVADDLFFYDEDKVYHITNITTFEYQVLESRLLQGRKITSAIVYYDKVYLSTLNGIFSKPVDRLFEGLE